MFRRNLPHARSVFLQAQPLMAHPTRLGVYCRDGGLDVAVLASSADWVDLCIIDETGVGELRYRLEGPTGGMWSGRIEGFGAGTHYGFRVGGTWDPDGGMFHNPAKLLLDPYGRAVEGSVDLGPEVYAHQVDDELYPTSYPLEISDMDSAGHVPLNVVIDTDFPVVARPMLPWDSTVIYELHVKGFTKNMPGIPEDLRGTYAGLAHPASVNYLKDLGVTAVELLPIHAKCDEPFLTERGLTNYWGYSTLAYFAPEPTYATRHAQDSGAQAVIDEFRGMVSLLHEAGIEVILDVVYNHTCEGGDAGPSLSWRGLDSHMYYRHTDSRPVQMIDVTGTGNSLNVDHPKTIQMILDSLRYWVEDMGVDGFRFDLAATLGRFSTGFTPMHPLLIGMATDPVLRTTKLIAEPWDVGLGGWQTGNFPAPFSEWNDHYRGTLRNFWLTEFRQLVEGGTPPGPRDLATRLAGSQDVFDNGIGRLRGPRASINFVTAHDGFTLADLTAYNVKHNRANLEENRDGSDDNRSWNHGVEGLLAVSTSPDWDEESSNGASTPTELTEIRRRTQRNLMTSMLISAGVPMITAGDEFSRTQFGNNNAYCQDGPISWVDWKLTPDQRDQVILFQWLIALRKTHPVMRPADFATGKPFSGDTIADLSWYSRSGTPLHSGDWVRSESRVFQMLRSGYPYHDRDFLVIFNASVDNTHVALPVAHGDDWQQVFSTSWSSTAQGNIAPTADPSLLEDCGSVVASGSQVNIPHQSIAIFFSVKPQGGSARS